MLHKEQDISGKSVVVNKERVARINADAVRMTYSGAKMLHADALEATGSAIQSVTGEDVSIDRSAVGLVNAGTANIENSGIFAVKASVVRSPDIRAVVINAGEVQGNVSTVFNRESAFAFGAGCALLLVVWRLIRGLFGR